MAFHMVHGAGLLAALGKALGLNQPLLSMSLEVNCKMPPKVSVEFYANKDQTAAMTEAINGMAEAEEIADLLRLE